MTNARATVQDGLRVNGDFMLADGLSLSSTLPHCEHLDRSSFLRIETVAPELSLDICSQQPMLFLVIFYGMTLGKACISAKQ